MRACILLLSTHKQNVNLHTGTVPFYEVALVRVKMKDLQSLQTNPDMR